MSDFDLSPYDPAYGKRLEFGELAREDGRTLNARSDAQITGAENLLTKAVAATASGDVDRAERLIRRAADMPYDPREECSPGILGGSVLINRLISDRFEGSHVDDAGWLDVALEVHARVDGPGKAELASEIHDFARIDPTAGPTVAERRRIQEAVGDAPLDPDLGDGPELTVEGRCDILRSLVATALALEQGYARL